MTGRSIHIAAYVLTCMRANTCNLFVSHRCVAPLELAREATSLHRDVDLQVLQILFKRLLTMDALLYEPQVRRLICACLARLFAVGDSLPLYSRVASLQAYLSSKVRSCHCSHSLRCTLCLVVAVAALPHAANSALIQAAMH